MRHIIVLLMAALRDADLRTDLQIRGWSNVKTWALADGWVSVLNRKVNRDPWKSTTSQNIEALV